MLALQPLWTTFRVRSKNDPGDGSNAKMRAPFPVAFAAIRE